MAGFAALLYGLFGPDLGTTQILIWMGLGALLVFLGVALFSSRLVRPLARLLGWPATKIGGTAGTLARDNSQRNPQRTASTASALMIGLALVTLVATLAAGIVNSFRGAVNDLFTGDYAITAQNNFSPIPTAASEAVEDVPGVTAVGNVRTGEARIFGSTEFATAVDPGMREVISMDWVAGSQDTLATLGADGAFTDDGYAKDHDSRSARRCGSPSRAAHEDVHDQGDLRPAERRLAVRRRDDLGRHLGQGGRPPEEPLLLREDDGVVRPRRTRPPSTRPSRTSPTRRRGPRAVIDNQISGLSSILNILYVLLALSVIVSLFGIVNTLVLTVFERTREIGMLRAIGMTRRQVRRMIRHESIITSLIGATLGIALGLVLAGLLIARVDFIEFTFPTAQVIVFAIAAILVGILAAIFPAAGRRS